MAAMKYEIIIIIVISYFVRRYISAIRSDITRFAQEALSRNSIVLERHKPRRELKQHRLD